MQNRIILVLGKKGSGKSFFVKNVLLKKLKRPVFIIDPLAEYPGKRMGLSGIVAALRRRKIPPVINFISRTDEEEERFFKIIFRLGNCTLIIEEADLYCNPQFIPSSLANLLKRGRHRGIDMVFITRRPAEINRLISAQTNTIISFYQNEPRDLKWLDIWAGDGSGERVRNLEQFEYEVFGDPV